MSQPAAVRHDSPTEQPGVATRRLEVAGWLAMFVYAASTQAPAMCLPQIGSEFGLNFAGQGAIASLRTSALLVALLVAGAFAGRFGKAPFLVAGLALVAVGIGGTTVALGYAMLLAAQIILGAGNGMMEALVNPLVAELRPRDAARALNVTHALFPVGLVCCALLSGELLDRDVPWRATVIVWLPIAVLSCLMFATRCYPQPHVAPGRSTTAFLRRKAFWGLTVAMVLAGGTEVGLTTWAPSFLERELGASARSGAMAIILFGVAMAVGRFGSGAILRRMTPITLTVVSAVLGAAALFGFGQARDPRVAWAFAGVGGLAVACFWPTLLAIATEVLDDTSTAMLALLAAAGIFGCALFPWLLGLLGDAFSLRAGLVLLPVAMLALAGVLMVLLVVEARRARGQSSAP